MKRIKGTMALLLAAALLLCLAQPAFAFEDTRAQDVSGYPVIECAGSASPLYFDEGTEHQAPAHDLDSERSKNLRTAAILKIVLGALTLSPNRLADGVVDLVFAMYGDAQMNPDGSNADPRPITRNGSNRQLDNYLFDFHTRYSFDWRQDPMDLADGLEDYIDWVIAETGMDKVNLVGTSGSGQLAMAYLYKHKTDKLASVVFNVSYHNGAGPLGALALKKIALEPEAVAKRQNPDNYYGSTRLSRWLRPVFESGIFEFPVKWVNLWIRIVFKTCWVDRIYDEAAAALIFSFPGYLGFVPLKDYDRAKRELFKNNPVYEDYLLRADRYHYEVMPRTDEILQDAAEHIKVGLRAGYGVPLDPIFQGSSVQSDAKVETVLASSGATCAPLDRPFPLGYCQKIDCGHSHVSPDGFVDASTCALPEQTWFGYKGHHQAEYLYSGWYQWFLRAQDATVHGSDTFPQFCEMTDIGQYRTLEPAEQSRFAQMAYALLRGWRALCGLPALWMDYLFMI